MATRIILTRRPALPIVRPSIRHLSGARVLQEPKRPELLEEYRQYFALHPPNPDAESAVFHGFIGKRRDVSGKLSFADLTSDATGSKMQLVIQDPKCREEIRNIPPHSPVVVVGRAKLDEKMARTDIVPTSIHCLNPFDKNIVVAKGARFPATARHLQLRFQPEYAMRLVFRSWLKGELGRFAQDLGYTDIETPQLFKSTPEGAREFLVPTRQRGFAYALPQSPQQYKQILMAAGIRGYRQFARCFRDEDLRADRQPEFTQFDLEKSFASGSDVMRDVEEMVHRVWTSLRSTYVQNPSESSFVPISRSAQEVSRDPSKFQDYPEIPTKFLRLTYDQCMESYGSDKPDLRIPNPIVRLDEHLSENFVGMISHLQNPIVEAWKLPVGENSSVKRVRQFIKSFMDDLPDTYRLNPHGAPQPLVYDPKQPLAGFSSLGPGGLESLREAITNESGLSDICPGDVVIFQARERAPFQGGSTKLGDLRIQLYQAAVAEGLLDPDTSFNFLWVTHFPLFSPDDGVDPGQGGSAGFSSTHHPFTAPLSDEDFELLFTDPLRAKADHYDLVLNGVELGGGSRRIHVPDLQEFIMRNILKMSEERLADFSHLLTALRAGCPPHAGFAFGFDRLCAMLSGTNSIRDVISFPKSMKGEDLFAKSPGVVTDEQLETYHLRLAPDDSPSSEIEGTS